MINFEEKYNVLLAEFEQYKKESIKWSIHDFLEYDQERLILNKDQAQAALEDMIEHHDANYGITWETVFDYIQKHGTLNENFNKD